MRAYSALFLLLGLGAGCTAGCASGEIAITDAAADPEDSTPLTTDTGASNTDDSGQVGDDTGQGGGDDTGRGGDDTGHGGGGDDTGHGGDDTGHGGGGDDTGHGGGGDTGELDVCESGDAQVLAVEYTCSGGVWTMGFELDTQPERLSIMYRYPDGTYVVTEIEPTCCLTWTHSEWACDASGWLLSVVIQDGEGNTKHCAEGSPYSVSGCDYFTSSPVSCS